MNATSPTTSPGNKPSHTPGPWRVEQFRERWLILAPAGHPAPLATVHSDYDHLRATSPANAALIAAAPRMLDALRVARLALRGNPGGKLPPGEALARVEYALASATDAGPDLRTRFYRLRKATVRAVRAAIGAAPPPAPTEADLSSPPLRPLAPPSTPPILPPSPDLPPAELAPSAGLPSGPGSSAEADDATLALLRALHAETRATRLMLARAMAMQMCLTHNVPRDAAADIMADMMGLHGEPPA